MHARITAAEVRDRLRRGERIQFVDARSPDRFATADEELHGALRVLPGQVDSHVRELSRNATIVVYSDDPDDRAAAEVVERLHWLGIRNAHVLLGGWEAARAEGLPRQYKPQPVAPPPVWGVGHA